MRMIISDHELRITVYWNAHDHALVLNDHVLFNDDHSHNIPIWGRSYILNWLYHVLEDAYGHMLKWMCVTLPPKMSRTDTRSQCRMPRFSIYRTKILIFSFHQNWVLQAFFCMETLLLIVKCDVLWVSGILNCNCCNTVVYETNFLRPISQNGTLYGSQIDLLITFEPVGRFA